MTGTQVTAEDQQRQLAAKAAFVHEQRIKSTVRTIRAGWVRLAEDLYAFQHEEMWRDLGYDSFEGWLADPDVDIERRWAFQLIANWRETAVLRGADPKRLATIAPARLQEILPAVRRNLVSMEDAMEDAATLSRYDLRARYGAGGEGTRSSANGSRPDTGTDYDAEREPAMAICPACGSRVREENLR
jgi:hypothetical protein